MESNHRTSALSVLAATLVRQLVYPLTCRCATISHQKRGRASSFGHALGAAQSGVKESLRSREPPAAFYPGGQLLDHWGQAVADGWHDSVVQLVAEKLRNQPCPTS